MKVFYVFLFFLLSSLLMAQETAPVLNKEDAENPVCLIKTSLGDIYVELFIKEAPLTVKNFIDLAEGKKENINKCFYDNLIFHRVIKNFMIQGGCPKGNGTGDAGYKFEDEINADDLGLGKMSVYNKEKGFNPMIGDQRAFYFYVIMPICQQLGIKSQEDLDKRQDEVIEEISKMSLKDYYQKIGYKYNTDRKSHRPVKGSLAMANSGPNTNGSQFFINVADTPWLAGKHTVFGKVIHGMDIAEKISLQATDAQSRPKEQVAILSIRLYQEK